MQRSFALSISSQKLTNKEIYSQVSQEIIEIWDRAAILHIRKDVVEEKVSSCMEKLRTLLRHWQRLTKDKDPLKKFIVD